MSYSSNFTVVLDACVLYPASIRDLLLSLADQDLYRPKWSRQIQDEWRSNLATERPDIPREILIRTIDQMNRAFPDAMIGEFSTIQSELTLPDPNDRHVLAAAIEAKANCIVTSNLKDFPSDYIAGFDIEVVDPDTFIVNLIDLDEELALKALLELSARLKNPPKSPGEILDAIEKSGFMKSAERFRKVLS